MGRQGQDFWANKAIHTALVASSMFTTNFHALCFAICPLGAQNISQQHLTTRRVCWSQVMAEYPEHEAPLTSDPGQPSNTALPRRQCYLRLLVTTTLWGTIQTIWTGSILAIHLLRHRNNQSAHILQLHGAERERLVFTGSACAMQAACQETLISSISLADHLTLQNAAFHANHQHMYIN